MTTPVSNKPARPVVTSAPATTENTPATTETKAATATAAVKTDTFDDGKKTAKTNAAIGVPAPIDPSTLAVAQPRVTSFPTRDVAAEGVKPAQWQDASGHRLGLDQVADNVKKSGDPIASVAAIISRAPPPGSSGPVITYKGYGSLSNARPTVNDSWSRGNGECDAIHSTAAYLLVKSGAVPKDDVAVVQSFAQGGWHNVTIFRDPADQKWKAMDYQKIVTLPEARNKEDAARQYFNQNGGVSVMYRIDDKNDRPVGLYHVKSEDAALGDAMRGAPGLPAGMRPNYGTNRGLNDSSVKPLPSSQDAPGMTAEGGINGASVSVTAKGGTRTDVAVNANGGSTIAGASVLTPTGANSAAGAKVIFRENAGGSALTVAGESWRIRGGNFLGVVGGMNTQIDVVNRHNESMTTVAPFIQVSGGGKYTIKQTDTISADVYWNANAHLQVPFVVGAAAQANVLAASNGMSPGGKIDPGGLASNSGADANAGIRASVKLGDNLTLKGTLGTHVIATDPTLAPAGTMALPFRGSVDGSAALSYATPKLSGEIGVKGTVGSLYDKDLRISGWAAGRVQVTPGLSLSGTAQGGQYVSGQGFLDVGAGVDLRLSRSVSVNVNGGSTVFFDAGQPAAVAPRASAGLTVNF